MIGVKMRMIWSFAALASGAALVGALVFLMDTVLPRLTTPVPTAASLHIELRSDPFPLAVGNSALYVRVLDAAGDPVEVERLDVDAELISRMGALPMRGRPVREANGDYRVPLMWSMMGQWQVEVSAALPGSDQTLNEQFNVFVFPTQVDAPPQLRRTFVSEAENAALRADPERDFVIIIPLGTGSEIRSGHGDEVIPAEIRLQVGGRSRLIIQNNDIMRHTIGPFTVEPGEIVRQEFSRPAIYEGTCTINHDGALNIIVEA
jgi:hypothetical protein